MHRAGPAGRYRNIGWRYFSTAVLAIALDLLMAEYFQTAVIGRRHSNVSARVGDRLGTRPKELLDLGLADRPGNRTQGAPGTSCSRGRFACCGELACGAGSL